MLKKNLGHGRNMKPALTILLLAVILIGVYLIMNGMKITVGEKKINVSGLYGFDIPYENITETTLEEMLPDGFSRVSGIDFFNSYAGNFKSEDMGSIKVLIKSKKGPFIIIKEKDNFYIINEKNIEKTKETYESIIKASVR